MADGIFRLEMLKEPEHQTLVIKQLMPSGKKILQPDFILRIKQNLSKSAETLIHQ